jgi:hypothetical protein
MEAGMRYFFARFLTEKAEKKPDWDTADSALLQAVAIAKDITPYRHARLATMKLSYDPNGDRPLNELSREELRQKVIEQLQELEALVPRRHCNVAEDERIHRLSFRRGDGEARQRSPDIDAQTYRFCARWTAFALPGYRDYSAR